MAQVPILQQQLPAGSMAYFSVDDTGDRVRIYFSHFAEPLIIPKGGIVDIVVQANPLPMYGAQVKLLRGPHRVEEGKN